MLVSIDVNTCLETGLDANQFTLLTLLLDGQLNTARIYFDRCMDASDTKKLSELGYFLGKDDSGKVILNKVKTRELLKLSDSYFWEFFGTYPIKVPARNGGTRALRTQRVDTKQAKDMKRKYEKAVPTKAAHTHVMRCLEADLAHRIRSGSLQFMPAMEAYVNGRDWEMAEHLLESSNNLATGKQPVKHGHKLI